MVRPRSCRVIYYFNTPTLGRRHQLFGRVTSLLLSLYGRVYISTWRSQRLLQLLAGSCNLFWLFSGFSFKFYLVVDCNAFQCFPIWFPRSLSLFLVYVYISFMYLLFYSIVTFNL